MRATLNISSELLKKVAKLYEGKSISRAVEEALKGVVGRKRALER